MPYLKLKPRSNWRYNLNDIVIPNTIPNINKEVIVNKEVKCTITNVRIEENKIVGDSNLGKVILANNIDKEDSVIEII